MTMTPLEVFYRLSAFDAPRRGFREEVEGETLAAAAVRAFAAGAPQIFWRNVRELGWANKLPAETAGKLAAAERTAFSNGLYWRACFRAFLAEIAPSGISCAPLKGLSLAARVYGEEALRMTSDLDVLIDPADFERCRAALERTGFRLRDVALRGVLPNHGQECVWTNAEGSEIDLHYRLFSWYDEAYIHKIDSRDFLRRGEPGIWDGFPVRFLSATDELHYLFLLAASDGAFRYFVDVDAYVYRLGASIDWTRLGTALSRGPVSSRVRGVARFLESRFGTPFPAGFVPHTSVELSPGARRASKTSRRLSTFLSASPADQLRLAGVFARWRVFKWTGLFRDYFIRVNNPVPRAFP